MMEAANITPNVLDLGIEIPCKKFTLMMYLNLNNSYYFIYLRDCLLKVQGIISGEEM